MTSTAAGKTIFVASRTRLPNWTPTHGPLPDSQRLGTPEHPRVPRYARAVNDSLATI